MTISELMEKMIAYSGGNIHDIDHLIRVWTCAKTESGKRLMQAVLLQ